MNKQEREAVKYLNGEKANKQNDQADDKAETVRIVDLTVPDEQIEQAKGGVRVGKMLGVNY